MATPDQIQAVIDPDGSDLECNLVRTLHVDATYDEHYIVGGTPPYSGKARWVRTTASDTAAVQGAAILTAMAL
jgi:hypothetical protein